MDSILSMAVGKAQALYDDVQENEIMMIKLKVTINGIIEGLEAYKDLSQEGPSQVIDSIVLALEQAQIAVDEVRARGAFTKYIFGSKDKIKIQCAVDLLNTALESLLTKIKLANEGAIRGQNIT